jgi:hypothetical protein
LQIILAGQPELADKLASRQLSQLRQRISLVNGLPPLSVQESQNYVDHRLRIAGYQGGQLFAPGVMQSITQFTEGIPRNINNFCFNALSLGCALGERVIGMSIVEEVISDLDITKHVTEATSAAAADYPVFSAAARATTHEDFPLPSAVQPIAAGPARDSFTPEAARAYMQQFAVQLRNWKSQAGPD